MERRSDFWKELYGGIHMLYSWYIVVKWEITEVLCRATLEYLCFKAPLFLYLKHYIYV